MKRRFNVKEKKSNDTHENNTRKKGEFEHELPKYQGCHRFALLLLPVTELGNGTELNANVVAGRTSSCDMTVPVVTFVVATRVAEESLRD